VSAIERMIEFDVAAPALVERRALQQRIDRKFLLGGRALPPLLGHLRSAYVLLLAGDRDWARYQSVYFDTPERELFHAHRRGLRPRYKIRIRHHVDRRLSFLEIKHKERNGRTTKTRLDLPFSAAALTARERRFIETHAPVSAARLVPCVSIFFLRLTLVGRDAHERLTMDRNLRFSDGVQVEELPHVVVAEVKQERHATAGAVATLLAQQAREASVSKYCLGTILLASVPANVFKPALRAIERLSE
jgi:VTC domain